MRGGRKVNSERDQQIYDVWLKEQLSLDELADKFDLSASGISRALERSILKLRLAKISECTTDNNF